MFWPSMINFAESLATQPLKSPNKYKSDLTGFGEGVSPWSGSTGVSVPPFPPVEPSTFSIVNVVPETIIVYVPLVNTLISPPYVPVSSKPVLSDKLAQPKDPSQVSDLPTLNESPAVNVKVILLTPFDELNP